MINPIGENQPNAVLESTNREVNTNQPIPDNKPDIKTDIISDSCKSQKTKAVRNDDIKPFIDIWNEIAVPIGCPKQGYEKRTNNEIRRNIKTINENWDCEFNPKNFKNWLLMAIELKFYLLTKPGYMKSMNVLLRWEHFYEAYNKYVVELNKNKKR